MYQPACDLPERGYFFRPTLFTNVAQSHRIAREEIFGPVLSVLTFRTPGGGGREGEQHAVRPVRRGLDRQGQADPVHGQADEGRRRLGEHVQPLRPDLAVRRLQGVRLRARGRHARPPRLRPARGPRHGASTSPMAAPRDRIDVRKTYKLYIGGAFPRSESGRSYVGRRPRTASRSPTPVRASRKDLRDAVRAARKAVPGVGRQDRDEPRPGPVSRRRADGGPARPVRRRGRRGRGPAGRPRPRRSSTARSIAGSGTPAGPTRSPRCSARRTRSRRRTSTSRSPSRPASSGSSRRRRRRCSGSSRGSRRRSSRGNAVVVLASETRPLPAITLSEVLATSDVPGGVVNVLTGRKRELVPVLAAHVDVDALDVWGVPADLRTEVELLAAEDIKRSPGDPRRHRREVRLARRPRRRAARVDRRLPRDEDRLAPDRDLTRAGLARSAAAVLPATSAASPTSSDQTGPSRASTASAPSGMIVPPPTFRRSTRSIRTALRNDGFRMAETTASAPAARTTTP